MCEVIALICIVIFLQILMYKLGCMQGEHYSLRYTEVYAVECMYLRREVSKLKQQNENLEQRLKMLEQSVK